MFYGTEHVDTKAMYSLHNWQAIVMNLISDLCTLTYFVFCVLLFCPKRPFVGDENKLANKPYFNQSEKHMYT